MNRFQKLGIAAILILGTLVISLFNRWEMGGETWGYWHFSRVFAETGRFIIHGRSPLYTLYLNLFRWLGYPMSVTVEYIVTSSIAVGALVFLFRRYLGLWLAVFASVLWIPFMQTAEPPVQKLALACSCLAVGVRGPKPSRFRFALFYALLGAACLFRSSYIVLLLVFVIWDLVQFLKKYKAAGLIGKMRPQPAQDWPLVMVIGLVIWFSVMQSPLPSNNAGFGSSRWFPNNGKSFTAAALVGHYNWRYVEDKYGDFKGRDFYFTNKELFGGRADVPGIFFANPKFIMKTIIKNSDGFVGLTTYLVDVRQGLVFSNKYLGSIFGRPKLLPWTFIIYPMFLAILWGAWRISKKSPLLFTFVIGSLILAGSTVISMPKDRYMVPLIPIFILSAYWYGRIATIRWPKLLSTITILLVLVLFSNATAKWGKILGAVMRDIPQGKISILENESDSMQRSFKKLEPLILNSKGVMALEHSFIAAFIDIPLDKIYDVWEIPPFGRLGDSIYQGLTPQRINGVFISNNLATNIGYMTNFQIRYQNYIKPYAEKLRALGGKTYVIKDYGQAVILP